MADRATRAGPAAWTGGLALPRGLQGAALLLLCGAHIQGPVTKLLDWPAALAEMERFGLSPPALAASAMILSGIGLWLCALLLAAFTLAATLVALPFRQAAPEARLPMTNPFFGHLGLVGGLVLVAWSDLEDRARPPLDRTIP